MSEIAIQVKNLGKAYKLFESQRAKILDSFGIGSKKRPHYQEFWALRNVSLVFPKGQRVGLIGNNGAGKSTLLKLLIGNLTPNEGSIEVNGKFQALMELGTGFHPEFTGRENIRSSLAYQGISPKDIQALEEEIIDFSELDDFIDRPIRTYSAGMNARLAFSVATAVIPDILVVDEILGAGDAYFAGKSVERMRQITSGAGATVLFVSHDLNSVLQLCDRVIWIDRGQVKMDGKPLEIIKEYNATVRAREEQRLRRKTIKECKKAESSELFFRFVLPEEHAKDAPSNKVYAITLHSEEEALGEIDVGAPMDNNSVESDFAISTPAETAWKQPEDDSYGSYRQISSDGTNRFAVFKVTCPAGSNASVLNIHADLKQPVDLQLYTASSDSYSPLATLPASPLAKHTVSLLPPSSGTSPEQTVLSAESLSEVKYQYGSQKMQIVHYRLLNEKGEDVRIWDACRPVRVEIDYDARDKIGEPVFSFCVYLPDGRVASQWLATSQEYGNGMVFEGKGTLSFVVPFLQLGQGSYVGSFGIHQRLRRRGQGDEVEDLHIIDRGVLFEVRQPLEDNVERGICLQTYTVDVT